MAQRFIFWFFTRLLYRITYENPSALSPIVCHSKLLKAPQAYMQHMSLGNPSKKHQNVTLWGGSGPGPCHRKKP